MAEVARVRVEWNGLTGMPGISTFYVGTTDADISELVTFFTAIRGLWSSGLTWVVPNVGDVLDVATGELLGTHIFTGGGSVSSNGTAGVYAAGVGARVQWLTADVKNGRRVRGTTFLTHLKSTNFDNTGTIDGTTLSTIQTAASALVASGSPWGVYSRPRPGLAGSFHAWNAATVPDKVAWLTTRKN